MGYILAVDKPSPLCPSPCRRDCIWKCQEYICGIWEAGLSSPFSWSFL